MKPVTIALAVCWALALAMFLGAAELGDVPAIYAFLDAFLPTKLADLCLMAMIAAILAMEIPALISKRPSEDTAFLDVAIWVGPLLGLAVAAYGAMTIVGAMQQLGVTNPQVIAPSAAEALLPLVLGLLVGVLSAGLKLRRAGALAKAA